MSESNLINMFPDNEPDFEDMDIYEMSEAELEAYLKQLKAELDELDDSEPEEESEEHEEWEEWHD